MTCASCGNEDMVEGWVWGFRILPVWACDGGCGGCQDIDWNFLQGLFFDFCWLFNPHEAFPVKLKHPPIDN